MIGSHSKVLRRKTRSCFVEKGDSFSDSKKNIVEKKFNSLRNRQFCKFEFQEVFKIIQILHSTKQEKEDNFSLSATESAIIKLQNQSFDDWKKAIDQIGKINKLNQRDNIQKLFDSWDELNHEEEQKETLKIIQSLEGVSI